MSATVSIEWSLKVLSSELQAGIAYTGSLYIVMPFHRCDFPRFLDYQASEP